VGHRSELSILSGERFFLSIISMRRAVESCPVSLDRVEEQHKIGAIHTRMRHHRNRIARLVRRRSPPAGGHDADSRGLDCPYSHRGPIRRAGRDSDDDVAVGVLPPVLLHDSPIRNVLAHVEHRAGMVGEHRRRRQGDSGRHCQRQQRTASARSSSNHQDRSIAELARRTWLIAVRSKSPPAQPGGSYSCSRGAVIG